MRTAWSSLQHIFAVADNETFLTRMNPQPSHLVKGPRCSLKLLRQHPVDLLVVGRQHIDCQPQTYERDTWWERLVDQCPTEDRPKYIIETWNEQALMWNCSPMDKGTVTRWSRLGYDSRCNLVAATELGGAISQQTLLVVRTNTTSGLGWQWATFHPGPLPRSMQNLLLPDGLLPPWTWRQAPTKGTRIFEITDPMPYIWKPWIRGPRGTRQITIEELGKALGYAGNVPLPDSRRMFYQTISAFHCEYITSCLQLLQPAPGDQE